MGKGAREKESETDIWQIGGSVCKQQDTLPDAELLPTKNNFF